MSDVATQAAQRSEQEGRESLHRLMMVLLRRVRAQKDLDVGDQAWLEYWQDIEDDLFSHTGSGWKVMTDPLLCMECGETGTECRCLDGPYRGELR